MKSVTARRRCPSTAVQVARTFLALLAQLSLRPDVPVERHGPRDPARCGPDGRGCGRDGRVSRPRARRLSSGRAICCRVPAGRRVRRKRSRGRGWLQRRYPRPAARRAAGPATGSHPPSRRGRSHRVRVSYPMSDSMSCIRRAKENASEIRSEKPGRQRSTLFSLPQREAELLRHDTLSDEDSLLARLFHQSKFQRHFGSGNRLRRSVGG